MVANFKPLYLEGLNEHFIPNPLFLGHSVYKEFVQEWSN